MLPTNPTAIDFLVDLMRNELSLADNRVNVYNQKFNIPNDPYLFVGVEYKFSKVFASKSEALTNGSGVFQEKQGLNTQEHYSVILFSRNTEALTRKEEAVQALGSIYSQQQGDRYGFKIARIAPIQDLSGLEGAAILYRFEVNVVMLCRYEKIKSVPWYGTFPMDVTVENGEDVTTHITAPALPT
jgi:hypothetical protein